MSEQVTPTRAEDRRRQISLAVVLAGAVPLGMSVATRLWGGGERLVNEPLHSLLEVLGGCIAMGVALLLQLRTRYLMVEARHLLWVIAALLMMGIMDLVHGVLPFGVAWSWTRHVATLAGGVVFAGVWLPVGAGLWKRRTLFAAAAAGLSVGGALLLSRFPALLPAPWIAGGYTVWAKGVNAAGGLGFLLACVFFLRRFGRGVGRDDLVFGSQALLFGISSLAFWLSTVWGVEWWLWHFFRLAAYSIVVVAAYRALAAMHEAAVRQNVELEEKVRERTAVLSAQAALLDLSPDGIIVRELDGTIRFWNQGAYKMYGWTKEEALGKRVDALLRTELPRPLDQIVAELQSGGVWSGEVAQWTKDGRRLAVQSRWATKRGERGGIELLESNVDITERKRAEEALRESEGRFRGTFENAAVGIANVGPQGQWLAVNQKLCQILGYSRDELLQRRFQSLTHPEDLAMDVSQFERVLRGEIDTYELEKRYFHKGGHVIWAQVTVGARRDERGQLLYCVSVIQDIGARKQAEQELEQAQEELARTNAGLERRVDERTAELREAMAEMEQMSYSMIHDLRAPLRAIQSFAGILAEDPESRLSEEGRDLVARMRTAANRMDHLVSDMLRYSSIVRGKLPLRPVDVGALARGIVETYPNLRPPRAEVRVAPDLPVVVGNEAALTQCLSQLLDNAVKFAKPRETPRIQIRGEYGGDGWVRIVVEDNGIGIAPEYQDKIFGMFQRLTNTGEGTGIGLPLVKKAAERMGGRVGVESELGKGSRFWVELRGAGGRGPKSASENPQSLQTPT